MLRGLSRGAATHSQRLEKWLGREETERLSVQFRSFYYPVPVAGVPGRVYVMPGGDFAGPVEAGQEMSALDRADAALARHRREVTRYRLARMHPWQRGAFGDLNALLQAQRGGKAQTMTFQAGAPGVNAAAGIGVDYWTQAGFGGSAGAAAPTGTSPTNTTTGALSFANPGNANTSHVVGMNTWVSASVGQSIILCDRLFMVAKTMNSTATEAVTGTFSRYQNSTSTAGDYIGGNFCYPFVSTTQLAATAHNWTVCKYTNQAGTAGQSIPSIAGDGSGLQINAMDLSAGSWFMPLASGDVGVKALTQMQASAAVATGTIDFVIAHPLAAFACPVPAILCGFDGINTAFNLVTVYDNACLFPLTISAGSTGGIKGRVYLVSE